MAQDPSSERYKLRVLCLHGYGTSSRILQQQIQLAGWDKSIMELMDLDFIDAPFESDKHDEIDTRFELPYLTWFRHIEDVSISIQETFSYLSEYMKKHGPFDGLLGFSQAGFVVGALAGFQAKKENLLSVPPIKFVIIVSGGIFHDEAIAAAYEHPIKCPSLHLIGARDKRNRLLGEALATKFESPVIIRHSHGHRIPPLDEASTLQFRSFLLRTLATSSMSSRL